MREKYFELKFTSRSGKLYSPVKFNSSDTVPIVNELSRMFPAKENWEAVKTGNRLSYRRDGEDVKVRLVEVEEEIVNPDNRREVPCIMQ